MDRGRCKVFMGITLSETGGAQKVVFQLLEGLPEDRFDVTLACRPGGALLDWVADLNHRRRHPIRVLPLPHLERRLSPVGDAHTFLTLFGALRAGQYDAAHFHSTKMGLLGRFAAWLAHVPTILFTVHGWGVQNEFSPGITRTLASWLMRAAAKRTTMTICVSKYDQEIGVRNRWTTPEGCCVIYNGAPQDEPLSTGHLRSLLGIPADSFLIGAVGRLVEAKHPELALQTILELRSLGATKTHSVFIGDGPLRARCEELIREHELETCVTLLGERQDAPQLMTDLSCLLHLSRYESFPLVTLEAMRAGLPIVATAVGGIPEQIRDGETGFLVGEDAKEAAERLLILLQNPDRRSAMGRAARKSVSQFTIESMVAAYLELYSR